MNPAGAAGVEEIAFVLDALITSMVAVVILLAFAGVAVCGSQWCARQVSHWHRSRRAAASVHAEAVRGLRDLERYLHQGENSS
jgi:hypothetical protein